MIWFTDGKTCTKCDNFKSLDDFYNLKRGCRGKTSACKSCAIEAAKAYKKLHPRKSQGDPVKHAEASKRWIAKNSDRYQDSLLKRKYGISLNDYNKMSEFQNGLCAICKDPQRTMMESFVWTMITPLTLYVGYYVVIAIRA